MNQSAKNAIISHIGEHPTAVISVIDTSGHPAGSVIYIAADNDLNIYFLTKRNTDKVAAIAKYPSVAFTLHTDGSQAVVQLQGEAKEITDSTQGEHALAVLATIKRDGFRLPISKLHAGPYIVYGVTVHSGVYTDFSAKGADGNIVRLEYKK